MRVGVIAGEFPVISETFVIKHITNLLDAGHDVDIYADYRPRVAHAHQYLMRAYHLLDRITYMDAPPIRNGQRFATAIQRGLVCRRLAPKLTASILNPLQYGRTAISLSALNRLYRLATTSARYDVVHAHFGYVADRFRFVSALWDAPLVVSFHGTDCTVYPRQHGRDCYRSLFGVAAAVTANSENTRRRLAQLGCPDQKLHQLSSAWDMDAFPFTLHPRQPHAPIRLLSVGRLVEGKGIAYAIRAVALLRDTVPHLRYDIVRDGPLRSGLQRLIAELGLSDAVTLHGAWSSEEVQRTMAAAHLFVHACVTSREGDEEGQGMVLVEAQASGLPVVATRHGPFPEVVQDGLSGYLVPERDPAALADRLAYLIAHPEVADAMGRAGRQHVEQRFNSRLLTAQAVTIYEAASEQYRRMRHRAIATHDEARHTVPGDEKTTG